MGDTVLRTYCSFVTPPHPTLQHRRQVAPAMGPLGLANVAWALATLKVSPPREVAELLMIEAQVG